MSQYSAEFIAKRLDKPRRNGNGWRACCPAHDDKEPSFDIEDGDKGPIFQCRSPAAHTAPSSRRCRDKGLWQDTSHTKKSTGGKAKPSSKGNPAKIVATYDYTDEQHVLLYQKVRLDPKSFRQRKPDGKGGWTNKLDGVRQVPYRLPQLLQAVAEKQAVFIVEGEKDGDNLVKLGFVATCNAGGAGKWPTELVPHFKGANIIIIPDNDKQGRNHCRVVGEALKDVAASIHVLELPDLPEKGDVSDWIAAGGTADQLRALQDAPVRRVAGGAAGACRDRRRAPCASGRAVAARI